jgi:hypothetical protein
MHSPSGAEMPRRGTGVCGFIRNETSPIQTLKRAITNPRLITAMFVLTQARNVRSFGENLRFDLVRIELPLFVRRTFFVSSKLDIHHQFVSRIAPGLAPPVSEGVNSTP